MAIYEFSIVCVPVICLLYIIDVIWWDVGAQKRALSSIHFPCKRLKAWTRSIAWSCCWFLWAPLISLLLSRLAISDTSALKSESFAANVKHTYIGVIVGRDFSPSLSRGWGPYANRFPPCLLYAVDRGTNTPRNKVDNCNHTWFLVPVIHLQKWKMEWSHRVDCCVYVSRVWTYFCVEPCLNVKFWSLQAIYALYANLHLPVGCTIWTLAISIQLCRNSSRGRCTMTRIFK